MVHIVQFAINKNRNGTRLAIPVNTMHPTRAFAVISFSFFTYTHSQLSSDT